jgi:hypothetical protein
MEATQITRKPQNNQTGQEIPRNSHSEVQAAILVAGKVDKASFFKTLYLLQDCFVPADIRKP